MILHQTCMDPLSEGVTTKNIHVALTWHDPLADQLLSGSPLLEFELEDCMEKRRVSVAADEEGKGPHEDPVHVPRC